MSRILIVEDDAAVSRVLSEFARAEGYEVETAATRQDARIRLMAAVPDAPFTLVILDIVLPDGDGLSLADLVHRCDPLTDIVILTGQGSLADAARAIRYGVTDFVSKPISRDEFKAMLQRSTTRLSLRRSGSGEDRTARMVTMVGHMLERLELVESELAAVRARLTPHG